MMQPGGGWSDGRYNIPIYENGGVVVVGATAIIYIYTRKNNNNYDSGAILYPYTRMLL